VGEHYRKAGSDKPQLPTWRGTPRAMPPPPGKAALARRHTVTGQARPTRCRRIQPTGNEPIDVLGHTTRPADNAQPRTAATSAAPQQKDVRQDDMPSSTGWLSVNGAGTHQWTDLGALGAPC